MGKLTRFLSDQFLSCYGLVSFVVLLRPILQSESTERAANPNKHELDKKVKAVEASDIVTASERVREVSEVLTI